MRRTSLAATAIWPIPLLVVAWVVMMLVLGQCAPIGSIPEEQQSPLLIEEPEVTLYSLLDETEEAPATTMQDSIFYSPPYVPKDEIGPYYKFPGRISIPRPE